MISVYRKRHEYPVHFFRMERSLVACTDIDGLMQTLNINHNPLDWRYHADSSKLGLKAVPLHNGKTLPSFPVGHSVHNKEPYENMKILMEAIIYDKFKWQICGDLKVIALLLRPQQGFTKYCCFICEWDSRARSLHYSRKYWPAKKSLEPGIMNVENRPLVEPSKILLPSMHLKLGLMKNVVKVMNQGEAAFTYLLEKFPRLGEAKLKEGIFIGPQIRDIIKDEYFDKLLQRDEKAAWDSLKVVVKVFLGNRTAQNYEELVNNRLQSYQKLGCNMSLNIHFLHSHLDFFPDICGAVSDEHGERYHQDISSMEKRYEGKWSCAMLADYCWTVARNAPTMGYKRHAKQKKKEYVILFVLNNEFT